MASLLVAAAFTLVSCETIAVGGADAGAVASRAPISTAYPGLGQEHWIISNARGAYIRLDDGSLWKIAPFDRIHTAYWLDTEEVVVVATGNSLYPYKLIGERDTAEARLVSIQRGDIDLYDSAGNPTAYIAGKDMTIYLWSGKPCAYLYEESVYGFNGKHLGWFESSIVYDNDGYAVVALPESFRDPVTPGPFKGQQELLPLTSLMHLRPVKPVFSRQWSRAPAKEFFLMGRY